MTNLESRWWYAGIEKRTDNIKGIAYYATDSRLTTEPDGKRYDWTTMIDRFKELGRKVTGEEVEPYRIN